MVGWLIINTHAPFPSHHLVFPTDSTPIDRGLLHIYNALDKKLQARIFLVVSIEKSWLMIEEFQAERKTY